MNKYILFLIAIVILTIGLSGVFVIEHENAHREIDIHHGCEDAIITYGFSAAHTMGVNCVDNLNRDVLNSQNEIVGYNVVCVMFTIILCTAVIGMLILNNESNKE